MKRHLKLIAVVTVVVMALSGFNLARSGGGKGGGSRSGGGSGGGGCGKDKSSSSRYNGGYRYNSTTGGSGSSGSGSSSRSREPDARIVSCAATGGKTVVELVSRGRTETFTVHVDFLDDSGEVVDTGSRRVSLKSGATKRVELEPDRVPVHRVDACRIDDVV
ncbi:hypothetical protein [Streptomyces megasporus]|uniref:hypothetical protein n=1 Tax=Streptomyces megasporus TaxID=44060 RepID=UPI000689AFA7|nr:hypothetical protein [Streptomyces megasporus]